MGSCLLCERPLAATPFYVESIQTNLYSLEELCYFLGSNIPLADRDVLNPSLALWLGEMCGYEDSDRLYVLLSEEGSEKEAYRMILKSSHYYTQPQVLKLCEKAEAFDALPEVSKMKARADSLIEHGKVIQAAKSYEAVSRMTGITETPKQFQSDVYYSAGCAYARLFQMKKAAECFEKAHELAPDEKTKKALVHIAYMDGGKEGFIRKAKELQYDTSATEELLDEINSVETPEVPEDLNEAVTAWIIQYHNTMG